MKKIFFAIIFLVTCLPQAMAGIDEKLDSIAHVMADYYGRQPIPGLTFNSDSTNYNINVKEMLDDPVARGFFEEIGEAMIVEQSVGNEYKIEIGDLKLEGISVTTRNTQSAKGRAVAIPQVTACSAIPYTYTSVDGKNNSVRLSSILYRPSPFQMNYNAKVGLINYSPLVITITAIEGIKALWNLAFGYTFDYGVLECHPTVTSSSEVPTGSNPLDYNTHMFCSDYAIVVCPDYCGYGLSGYKQHPYLVQGVTARNVVDGYIAALNLIKHNREIGESGSWKLADNFYTDLMGYSQGGSVALATLKYLESGQVDEAELKRINLRNVYCGDGPYSPVSTISQYVEWANSDDEKCRNLAYPCVLPLIISAAKDAYDNDCMRTVNVEDYFTPEFLATDIIKEINSKAITTEQLNAHAKAYGIRTLDQMASPKILKKMVVTENGVTREKFVLNTETNEYKCLMRAMELNDLSKGWTPHHPLLFMHFDGDLVVPVCNMKAVQKNMTLDPKTKVVFTDAYTCKDKLTPAWSGITSIMKFFENPDHGSIGSFFYIAAAAGVFEDMLK